jgi:hypothetical protein
MRDEDKTREQLINELRGLRKQLDQVKLQLAKAGALRVDDELADEEPETGEFEERARKVFSAERKEDIWVLIISAVTVILGLTGVITKKTFTSLFF